MQEHLVVAYYLFLLYEAFASTWRFARAEGIPVGIILAILGIAGEVWRWRMQHGHWGLAVRRLPRLLIFALSPVAILLSWVFLYELLWTPASIWVEDRKSIQTLDSRANSQQHQINDLAEELADTKDRVHDLLRNVPPPDLTPQQRMSLKRALEKMGPQSVLIVYLDSPDSRANYFAGKLEEVFESAGWHVYRRAEQWKPRDFKAFKGLYIQTASAMTPNEKVLLRAFEDSHMAVSSGCCLPGGRDNTANFELSVGEM